VKTGQLNVGPNHLSQIETSVEPTNIKDGLPDAQIFKVGMVDGHYEKFIQFLLIGKVPDDFTTSQKKQLVIQVTKF